MSNFAIVVIGYNRPRSIRRLLNRLIECEYEQDRVDLIVSLDNCGNNICERECSEIVWPYGTMQIRTHEKRLGLKRHILSCGDILLENKYNAIAVFEDDIYPAEGFYLYMKQVYEMYDKYEKIAGFSLYSPLYMNSTDMNFTPILSDDDVYFMQVAQSWGQIWTQKQWINFKKWFDSQTSEWENCNVMPWQIGSWGEQSWLKYYMRYCAEKKKYFVYPYKAFATCYSEAGQHTTENSTQLQVPIVVGTNIRLRLPAFSDACIRYDAFYENENLVEFIAAKYEIPVDEITIDLFATKTMHNRYYLTTRKCDYSVIDSFDLNMKPQEMNVFSSITGKKICLYDTSKNKKQKAEIIGISFLERFEYYDNCRFKRKTICSLFVPTIWRSFRHYIITVKNKKHK